MLLCMIYTFRLNLIISWSRSSEFSSRNQAKNYTVCSLYIMSDDQNEVSEERLETYRPRKIITDDDKVSKAPLHLAYTKRRNISKKQLAELVKAGYVIHRGRFTEKENKRLLKNWRRICRRYPDLRDPFAAVGLAHKPVRSEGRIVDTIVDGKTKRFFKQSKILERFAYKLDDRLLCDIYTRAKKLIGGRAFKYKTRKDLPEHLESCTKRMLIHAEEDPKDISCEMDISPFVLQNIKSNPERLPNICWDDQLDLLMEICIERQFNHKDPWSIPLHMIDWTKVAKEMIQCGLPRSDDCPKQLYRRWYRLNSQMATSVKKRQITEKDLKDNDEDECDDDGQDC